METTVAHPTPLAAEEQTLGPTFSELLQEFYREAGIVPPTAEEMANVPPWTDEEAVAFARSIDEVCEQIDEAPELL